MTTAPDDLGFSFRSTRQGEVRILRGGRPIVTLRDAAAAKFLAKASAADFAAAQQLCARVTGNYKKGNEALAAKVGRAKGRGD